MLQAARSRNDLNATVFRLKLRTPWASVVKAVAGLDVTLLRQAQRYGDVVMPIYTHAQAGVPGTLGHYLAGVACGVERDLRSILEGSEDLRRCPLGAGAAGGSTIPIDTTRTAFLLGFEYPVDHSIDAVASRDLALRLLGSLAIFGVTLSRLASDILQWSTAEFDLIELPDDLVGSSSAMPQKKNLFLAEHIIGMSAAPIGVFVQAAAAMRCAPYTNAVQVGTEALRLVADAVQSVERAAILARLMIAGLRPNRETMIARATSGFTTALEWANELMLTEGYDFRSAHHKVGEWVGKIEAGQHLGFKPPDPADVAGRAKYGGGPATLEPLLRALRRKLLCAVKRLREHQQLWRSAEHQLDLAVQQCIEVGDLHGGKESREPERSQAVCRQLSSIVSAIT
jgi:argininosuccinate lyase